MTTPDNFREIMDALARDSRHFEEDEYRGRMARIADRLVRRYLGLANRTVVARSMERLNYLILPEVEQAAERGDITWDESDDLVLADVVVSADGQDGEPCYVLAEISITIQQEDRDRAIYRAGLLERATGVTTIPVVIGKSEEDAEGDSGVPFWKFDPC